IFGGEGRVTTTVTDLSEVVLAALAVAATAWRATRTRHLGWALISASCAAWLAGQLVWTWHEVVQEDLAPTTSLADVGFLAAIPLAFAGFLLIGFRGPGGARYGWLHRVTET